MPFDDPVNDTWAIVLQMLEQEQPKIKQRVIVMGEHSNPMEADQYVTYTRFLDENGHHGGDWK